MDHSCRVHQGSRAANTIVDFRDHNLHVLNYSAPVTASSRSSELKRHIHTLPEQPELIPYRTSYYAENWGFCMAHRRLLTMTDDDLSRS